MRGHGEGARRVAIELETRSFATTTITAFELRSGAHSTQQRKSVDTLLEAMTILPFGAEEAQIAAVCIAHQGVLLTRNWKHFERVKALKLSGRAVFSAAFRGHWSGCSISFEHARDSAGAPTLDRTLSQESSRAA